MKHIMSILPDHQHGARFSSAILIEHRYGYFVSCPLATAMKPEFLKEISQEIAAGYVPLLTRTQLLLFEIDPFRIHATWHIDRATWLHLPARMRGREAQLVLRLYDMATDRMHPPTECLREIPVTELSNNWYINVETPARTFAADLGVRHSDGTYMWLATSNLVSIPPATPSCVIIQHEMNTETGETQPVATSVPDASETQAGQTAPPPVTAVPEAETAAGRSAAPPPDFSGSAHLYRPA
jgi:hypothetical protein